MLHPPRWLTNEAVDTIVVDEYDKIRQEFMAILEEEETLLYAEDPEMTQLSTLMNQGMGKGNFLVYSSFTKPNGTFPSVLRPHSD